MVAGSANGGTVLAGEEVEEVGGVAVHIVQEDCTITLTKTVRKGLYLQLTCTDTDSLTLSLSSSLPTAVAAISFA